MTSHREKCVHQARVYLQQARAFGKRGSPFAFVLLEWAGNARRRATAGGQMDLFATADTGAKYVGGVECVI